MIQTIDFHIPLLEDMKVYPSSLYYMGNPKLLERPKVAIVGTRHPLPYVKLMTEQLAHKLSLVGICVVSGGAIGVDTCAHKGAGFSNTIMVAGTGLDTCYPMINKEMIHRIEREGLLLSQFPAMTPSLKHHFPLRNELIVALSDCVIVPQADLKSGTMHSIQYALKMKKKIYVLPHRLGDSEGTTLLLKEEKATAIYDIDAFTQQFGSVRETKDDPFLEYCKTFPFYNDAIASYGNLVFEYECLGKIIVENGRIKCL